MKILIWGVLILSSGLFIRGLEGRIFRTHSKILPIVESTSAFMANPKVQDDDLRKLANIGSDHAKIEMKPTETVSTRLETKNIANMNNSELYQEIVRINKELKIKYVDSLFKLIEFKEEVSPGEFYSSNRIPETIIKDYQDWLKLGDCGRFTASLPGQKEDFHLKGQFRFSSRYSKANPEEKLADISLNLEVDEEEIPHFSKEVSILYGPEPGRVFYLYDQSADRLDMASEFPFLVFRLPARTQEPVEIRAFSTVTKTWKILTGSSVSFIKPLDSGPLRIPNNELSENVIYQTIPSCSDYGAE